MGNWFVTPNKEDADVDRMKAIQLTRIENELSALQASSDMISERKLKKRLDIMDKDRFSINQDRIGKLKMRRSLLNSRPEDEIVEEKKAFRMDQISRLDHLIQAYLEKSKSTRESVMKKCKTRLEELKKQKVESQWILDEIQKNENRT
jgi:hypothetical protein